MKTGGRKKRMRERGEQNEALIGVSGGDKHLLQPSPSLALFSPSLSFSSTPQLPSAATLWTGALHYRIWNSYSCKCPKHRYQLHYCRQKSIVIRTANNVEYPTELLL
jgi:hypothetical protein